MSGFDLDRVYSVSVHDQPAANPDAPSETLRLLNEFLLQFRVGGDFIYRLVPRIVLLCIFLPLYRDKLRANLLLKQFHLEVDLRHVALYNEDVAHAIQDRPGVVLPMVRSRHNGALVFP